MEYRELFILIAFIPQRVYTDNILYAAAFDTIDFAYINGILAFSGASSSDETIVLSSHFEYDEVTVVIHARSYTNPAGLIVWDSDGSLYSNTSWICTNEGGPGWENLDYDDSNWPDAVLASHSSTTAAKWIFAPQQYAGTATLCKFKKTPRYGSTFSNSGKIAFLSQDPNRCFETRSRLECATRCHQIKCSRFQFGLDNKQCCLHFPTEYHGTEGHQGKQVWARA